MNLAQYLIQLKPGLYEEAFKNACVHSRVDICEDLLQLDPTIDKFVVSNAFINACSNGRIDVAKWLYRSLPINPRYIDSGFTFACKMGQLEIAKWLLQIKPTIDISANDENTFRLTCENGSARNCKMAASNKTHY